MKIIRLYRPVRTPKAGEELQLDHDMVQELEIGAWIKQLSSAQAIRSLGIAATQAYHIRFRAPEYLPHEPATGWQIKDDEDRVYVVRAALRTGRMMTLTVERI